MASATVNPRKTKITETPVVPEPSSNTLPQDGDLAAVTTWSAIDALANNRVQLGADLDEFAGAGFSERPEDSITPFLTLLQKGSPQVDEHDPDYMPGAKAGMLMDTSTRELHDVSGADSAGLVMVQAYYEKNWVEWVPREAGKGFVAIHPIDDPIARAPRSRDVPNPKNPKKRPVKMTPDGHELRETAHHYLIYPQTLRPVVLGLSSTGLQTSRHWNEIYRNRHVPNDPQLRKYPSFASAVCLRTIYRSNDDGTWFQVRVEDLGLLDLSAQVPGADHSWRAVYAVARQFFKDAREHGVRVATPPTDGGNGPSSLDGVPNGGDQDDHIPF